MARNLFLLALLLLASAAQQPEERSNSGGRQGKDLLSWLGLSGADEEEDPYVGRATANCFSGDLADCFKSRALQSLSEFFDKPVYQLSEFARIIRTPQYRNVLSEPFEFSTAPRADESEWDQLVKFLYRRAERFMKSTAIEVQFPEEVTEKGRYSPRFVDEIATEIDLLDDKSESPFSRTRLKKLFIPLLVILKLFKLKLLLFLPLILGLASFKKLLGFLALVIPGLIGFFKICKPDLHHNYGSYGHSSYYHLPPRDQPHYQQYSPGGIANHYPHGDDHQGPGYGSLYGHGQGDVYARDAANVKQPVAFREDQDEAQKLAYRGYQSKSADNA